MKSVKVIIKWFVVLGAIGLIIRASALLLPDFKYLNSSDPWDWLIFFLLWSPAIPLVLFLFWRKPQKSRKGQVSPAKQLFVPWWMVETKDSPIARTLGRDRPIWQMAFSVVVALFAVCVIIILGMALIPHLINFMAARM